METAHSPIDEVRRLIEVSRPAPRPVLRWLGWGFLLSACAFLLLPADPPQMLALKVVFAMASFALLILSPIVARAKLAEERAEARNVELLDEYVQLRRWPEALSLARQLLGRPMRRWEARHAALLSLATTMIRYHEFEAARSVHDYLLRNDDGIEPDAATTHLIKLARAMTLLREDLLVDADAAMGSIRNDVGRARDQIRAAHAEFGGDEPAPRFESAWLWLLELYRDIKTGHFDEAIALHETKHRMMREQLGQCVADGWALVARAYDAMNRPDDAQRAYDNATTLVPPGELHRRYPETAPLADRYAAAPIPAMLRTA